MTPLISVAMPTRGRWELVKRAVASVLNQSLTDLELLILDNSFPPDKDKIRQISNSDPRIRFFDRGETGVTEARRLGATKASGPLFALIDSDDYWDRNRLTRHVEAWRNHRIGLSWDRWAEVNNGNPIEFPQPFGEGLIFPPRVAIRLYSYNFIHASSGIVTTRFARELGFPIQSIASSDWTLFMRAAEYYPSYFIGDCLSYKETDSPERVTDTETPDFFKAEIRDIRRWALRHNPRVYGPEYAKKKTLQLITKTKRLLAKDVHEPSLMKLLTSIQGEVYVDVGANRGQYVIPLSKNFERVIAIEPNPSHVIRGSNVEVLRFAISNRDGETNLYLDKHPVNPNWTLDTILESFTYRPGHDTRIDRQIKGKESIKVSIRTLDSVLSGIRRVELVKIDVEGAEFLVLEGAKESLASRKIMNLALEVHDRTRKTEMERILYEYGYDFKWVDRDHIFAKLRES